VRALRTPLVDDRVLHKGLGVPNEARAVRDQPDAVANEADRVRGEATAVRKLADLVSN
jgi:hypothetical protein